MVINVVKVIKPYANLYHEIILIPDMQKYGNSNM